VEEAPPELNSPSQGDPGPGTRDRLRWALTHVLPAVLALGLLVAGAGAGYLAYENDSRADKWRERADRLQRNADQLNELLIERTEVLNKRPEELNALAAKLKKAQRAIARSEEDVKTLERRQRQLANEKAQVEDARALLAVEAEALEEVASAYIDCSTGLAAVLSFVASDDFSSANAALANASQDCRQAEDALAEYNSGR
jgi:septal ring factor EnvC (AmiA/AmiB activator)